MNATNMRVTSQKSFRPVQFGISRRPQEDDDMKSGLNLNIDQEDSKSMMMTNPPKTSKMPKIPKPDFRGDRTTTGVNSASQRQFNSKH